jgi:CBS domain-containing protein
MINFDSLKKTPVSELLIPVKTVNPSEPVSRVIGFMKENNVLEAFCEAKEKTAIVTIRDLLDVKNITKTKTSTIMSFIPRLSPSNTVSDAATLMFFYRIRSLPVYEDSKLTGQITLQSIVERLMTFDVDGRIGSLMTPNPICLEYSEPVSKARSMMIRRKIDQIPILKDGKLKSAITSTAIVFNVLPETDRGRKGGWRGGKHEGSRLDIPIYDFAEPDITTNDVKDAPREVFDTMIRNGTNYSIILNYDEVQGIVTYRDFARLLVNPRVEQAVDNLPMYIVGLPEDPFDAELVRTKFGRIAQVFKRSDKDINEIRAVIKKGEGPATRRKRYEVKVFVNSPIRQHSYSSSGFELADIFDRVESWAKSTVARYGKGRKRTRVDAGLLAKE